VPVLFAVQRIADFGGNVYMLYMAEIAQNFRFLLLLLTPEHLKKCKVSRCNMQFGEIPQYGKKSTLLLRFLTVQYGGFDHDLKQSL
jgi:hypothetical protein